MKTGKKNIIKLNTDSNMKQTAVQWLVEQWPILESQLPPWLIEQAKAMEKEDKHSEYMRGWKDGYSKQEPKSE